MRIKRDEAKEEIRLELQTAPDKAKAWQSIIQPILEKQKKHCAHHAQIKLKKFLKLLAGGIDWQIDCAFQSLLYIEKQEILLRISQLAINEHNRLSQTITERKPG